MIIVGLTGSIGMGKSTTAQMFVDIGVPVYDADAAVHELYEVGGDAVEPIESAFPGTTDPASGVDREKLRDRVLNDPDAMKQLESIVHPLVGQARTGFLDEARDKGAKVVVLDIPLLFETGGDQFVDKVVVVSAPEAVQRERVLARPGMTVEAFEAILSRQTPDSTKREKADFVIDTSQGFDAARRQVRDILTTLTEKNDS